MATVWEKVTNERKQKMRKKIRIVKPCRLKIRGQMRLCQKHDEVDLDEEEAIHLIKVGIAVPGGVHHGRPVRIFDDER